ncbi:MAG: dihydrolipoyl dehydrogenase [Halorhodospira sp.]
MARRTRLLILGAGTAGLTALGEAQRWTDDVTLVDPGPLGTTCARVGCMPSKALLAVAHRYRALPDLAAAGLTGADAVGVDDAAVMRHVRAHRDQLAAAPARQARQLGERFMAGPPRFLDAHTVEVDGERIEAEATVIATGTRPVIPAPWQALGDRVVTSDTFFELERLGRRVAVIGLGPIGVELGQGMAQLGVEVYGFHRGEQIAGIGDPAVSTALHGILGREMHLHTGAAVALEDRGAEGVTVHTGAERIDVEWVLAATGRRPNLEGLGLEALPGALDASGAPALEPGTLRLGDLPIFLAGDVSGQRPLMHEAADEGRLAAYHALQAASQPLARRTPLGIVFTTPNVARVGQGYDALPETGWVAGRFDFGKQGRARLEGEAEGRLHVYADAETGRLLGAELAAPQGEHLAHLLAWSIQQGASVDDLLQMPYYHPTLEEGVRSALQSARKQLGPRAPAPDLPRADRPG